MLPSLALARPFTNNRDLLKNITFDKCEKYLCKI